MTKVFSGIQPTGKLTLGNYLGAIKNWKKMQNEHDCIFCIVDLHAITLPQNPNELRQTCIDNFAMYIACGIDPNRSIIFIQSAIGYHAELAWIFSCITPMGWLNRMTQFKDKAGKHADKANLGLYAYPVLMAADILLYDALYVPVGDDQTQHLELTRDIAGAFNRQFQVEYFKEPQAIYNQSALRIMSLRDGTKKMSKSDESDFSRINLTDTADLISQKLKKAKSDAVDGIYYDEINRPEVSNLINIFAAVSGLDKEKIIDQYSGAQTSKFKADLADALIEELAPIQQRWNQIVADPQEVHNLAQTGYNRANSIAEKRMSEIKNIVGLDC